MKESRTDVPEFGPEREADLLHTLRNTGGTPQAAKAPARTDLPPMVRDVPDKPPATWPAFDPAKPATDFQLQQALAILRAMPVGQHAAR